MNEYNNGFSEDFLKMIEKSIKEEDKRNPHPNYAACVEHAEDMSIHVYGCVPRKLLNITRPNEDNEIKNYRIKVYQPKTKSTANKGLSIISKIFNPSLYTIKWNKQSNNGIGLEDYCMVNYPNFNSVLVYLQEATTPKMIADPNGVIAVRPKEFEINDTDRAEPLVTMYGSKAIWYLSYDACLILKKYEEIKKDKVYSFEFYDDDLIIEFDYTKFTNGTFAITRMVEYPHGCPMMPVWQLRGTPEAQDDGTIMYKSFFEPALPYWNDAIGHESDLKGAFINHIHPLRYEYDEECTHIYQGQRCERGYIVNPNGGERMQCPACNGSGYRGSANSPYKIIRINRDKIPGQNESGNFPVPAGFIVSPTEPTDLLDKYVDKQHLKGLEALNMDVVNKIGENQSGVAKVIDRGELYDFLSRIATVVFDVHLTNIFYFINYQMFGVTAGEKVEDNLPTVVKPVQFDISSTFELVEQLSMAKKAGLNPNYLKTAQNEIIEKKFTDPVTRQNLQLVLDNDPLPDYEPDQIKMLSDGGIYKKTDVVIHFNIGEFIERALNEKGDKFNEMSKDDRKALLETYANEVIASTKVVITPPALPPNQ